MSPALRILRTGALVALLLTAAWLFLPTALGGATTYVSTHGDSMRPQFDVGDLAILRPVDGYAVGDVVAYRSTELDTVVMHRIVGTDGERFVLQGDHNTWLDPDRPTGEEILGRLWLHVPHGGTALTTLRSPGVLGAIALAALLVVGALRRPRGRHSSARPRPARVRPRAGFSTAGRARARSLAVGCGVVALLAAAGGVALLLMPTTQTQTRTVPVLQEGEFSYAGAAVPGTTYPTGRIETGDTVYTQLAGPLTVSLATTFSGPGLADLTGFVRLDVTATTPDGWTTPLTSGAPAAVTDDATTATVALDPAAARTLLTRHADEVGSTAGGATLTVTPVVDVAGTVDGEGFTASPLPALAFSLDATSLRIAGDASLASSASTTVTVDDVGPRTLAFRSWSVPIETARVAVLAVGAAALAGFALATWVGRGRRGDAADAFALRHGARILPVAAFTPGSTVIDVADADALHRVAERLDALVLHHAGPEGHTFAVRDGETTYRFVMPRAATVTSPRVRRVAPRLA
jgi:signal peptidase I